MLHFRGNAIVRCECKEAGLGHINNLNLPLYRIYAFDRFETLLSTGRDALVNPAKWQDPFENFFLYATEVDDEKTSSRIPLKNLAEDWYGQCWSMNKESDAMWRIYSPDISEPNKSGVKVQTTAQKIYGKSQES
jgi:hypothetical protein